MHIWTQWVCAMVPVARLWGTIIIVLGVS